MVPKSNLLIVQQHIIFMQKFCYALPVVQGLYSLNGKTSYRQASWSLVATKLDVIIMLIFWYLTGISAAPLPRCLPNFRTIAKSKLESRGFNTSRDLMILVNRGPVLSGCIKKNWLSFWCNSMLKYPRVIEVSNNAVPTCRHLDSFMPDICHKTEWSTFYVTLP